MLAVVLNSETIPEELRSAAESEVKRYFQVPDDFEIMYESCRSRRRLLALPLCLLGHLRVLPHRFNTGLALDITALATLIHQSIEHDLAQIARRASTAR